MKLKDTVMSSPICVKILKFQCISKNFLLLCRQFFPFITLKQTIFFSKLQIANNFFMKNVPSPPDKNNGLSLNYIKGMFNPNAVWHRYFLIPWQSCHKKEQNRSKIFFQLWKCIFVNFIEI